MTKSQLRAEVGVAKSCLLAALAVLSVTLVLLSGLAAHATTAEAHQSGCHRWHSCPSDTGSYVCGDLGYACQYPTYPTYPPDPSPGGSQYITRSEFRTWAKAAIREHFGDSPGAFWIDRCVRLYSAKMRCRVHWRDDGYWTSNLTIRETATDYYYAFRR
jgi:hypothetical protein